MFPGLRRAATSRTLITTGALALAWLAACSVETAGRITSPVPSRYDSALTAQLVGDFETDDTILFVWRRPTGEMARTLVRTRGPLGVGSPSENRFEGPDTRMETVHRDTVSAPAYEGARASFFQFSLVGSTLGGYVWDPVTLPRTAVSDSGLHGAVTDVRSRGCERARSARVPSDALVVQCRIALHWRRVANPT